MNPIKRQTIILTCALLGIASPLYAADIPVDASLGDVSINKVPFLIAADAGIYAKNGLNVHQFITPNAAAAARASGVIVPVENVSTAGNAPISIGGGSPMINGIVRNPEADRRVIVSTTEEIVRDHVIARPGIGSLQDLKGKRLGYSGVGTVTNYDTLVFVRKMGWDPEKDVTLVGGSATLDALKDDKVDAIVGSAMIFALAPDMNFKDLGDLSNYKMPLAGSGIMVERKWLSANRDITARFVKSAVEAVALMKSNRKIFDAALARWFNIKDPKVLDRMFASVKGFPDKPYPSIEGIKGAMEIYDSPAMRTHKPEEFYDSSFIAELDKNGFLDHPLK